MASRKLRVLCIKLQVLPVHRKLRSRGEAGNNSPPNSRGKREDRRSEIREGELRYEITPVKDTQTGIKPLSLSSGHGRYITVKPERAFFSVGEWPLPYIQPAKKL